MEWHSALQWRTRIVRQKRGSLVRWEGGRYGKGRMKEGRWSGTVLCNGGQGL